MKYYKKTILTYNLVKEPTAIKSAKITSSKDAEIYLKRIWDVEIETSESCYVLFLNTANNVVAYKRLSSGGINSTIIDPILLARYCIESLCTGVVLAHNHPTGNTTPSTADIKVTKKIESALKIIDVKLLDNLIITKHSYNSINDNNLTN